MTGVRYLEDELNTREEDAHQGHTHTHMHGMKHTMWAGLCPLHILVFIAHRSMSSL